jgi:hypothetical protein
MALQAERENDTHFHVPGNGINKNGEGAITELADLAGNASMTFSTFL